MNFLNKYSIFINLIFFILILLICLKLIQKIPEKEILF